MEEGITALKDLPLFPGLWLCFCVSPCRSAGGVAGRQLAQLDTLAHRCSYGLNALPNLLSEEQQMLVLELLL